MSERSKPLAASQYECVESDTLPMSELEPVVSQHVSNASKSVAIVGGGLAGMAAAAALCDAGVKVEIFEQSNRLGGRASSFEEAWNGQFIDQCQHVAMGCCTSFLDFCRRTGVADCFQRHKTYHFIGPDGAKSDLSAVNWLPAPFHLLPGLWRLKYLSWGERFKIICAMRKLIHLKNTKENDAETIGAWFRREGQSDAAIERFWSVVLTGALSETVDYASVTGAKKVFADGFCSSRQGYELITPRFLMGSIFDQGVDDWLVRARYANTSRRGGQGNCSRQNKRY